MNVVQFHKLKYDKILFVQPNVTIEYDEDLGFVVKKHNQITDEFEIKENFGIFEVALKYAKVLDKPIAKLSEKKKKAAELSLKRYSDAVDIIKRI